MEKIKKISSFLTHPCIIGLLIILLPKHYQIFDGFNILWIAFVLVLPKILIEFFLLSENIASKDYLAYLRVSLFYILLVHTTDILIFSGDLSTGTPARIAVCTLLYLWGYRCSRKIV